MSLPLEDDLQRPGCCYFPKSDGLRDPGNASDYKYARSVRGFVRHDKQGERRLRPSSRPNRVRVGGYFIDRGLRR